MALIVLRRRQHLSQILLKQQIFSRGPRIMQPYVLSLCAALTSGCLTGHTGEEQEGGGNRKKERETPAPAHLCEVLDEIIFTGVFPAPPFPLLFITPSNCAISKIHMD